MHQPIIHDPCASRATLRAMKTLQIPSHVLTTALRIAGYPLPEQTVAFSFQHNELIVQWHEDAVVVDEDASLFAGDFKAVQK